MAAGAASQEKFKPKGARRRLRLYVIVLCCFIGWAALTLWEQGETLRAKSTELDTLQTKLDEVRKEYDAYQLEVTRLNDDEYIEQRVRKDFGMGRQGDTIFDSRSE